MSYIKGKFKQSIFESETGYKVSLFKVSETDDEDINKNKTITITGYFAEINNEDKYILYGDYIIHNRYGYQYAVTSYEKIVPEGKDAIIDFLTSSFVKGCGEKLAKNIYATFQDKTLEKIKENKNNLYLVPKMTEKKAESIYKSIIKYFDSDKEILELKRLGFTIKETMNLMNTYGKNIINIIKNNIYLLVGEIDFKKLDNIFLKNNDILDDRRIKACIIQAMKLLSFANGDIYLLKNEITSFLKKEYRIDCNIDNYFINLSKERQIIILNEKYYLIQDYLDELNNATSISYLTKKYDKNVIYKKYIKEIENEIHINYNKEQLAAIKCGLENNISIITGGPGTGKTTIVKGIIRLYQKLNKLTDDALNTHIKLLAPTGRAAKRMSETTSLPAMTIHRFLKWDKDNNVFGVNELNKEKFDLFIIDEVSMLDNHLLSSFFKGINLNTKIIFIGDEYQLPSVGPGLILSNMINAGVKHISLKNIYRQSENSYIPILAKSIKEMKITEETFIKKDDFKFIDSNSRDVKNYLEQIMLMMQDKKIDLSKIQILAPMYKGENGIDNLNILLQKIFNSKEDNKNEVKIGPIIYRVGDKILNLVNDPDNNIYNGDIGYISEVNIDSKNDFLIIDYYNHKVSYKKESLNTITHGYAISIHKAQGSEFEYVIMPVVSTYSRMLYNKLLYTGVSRAKKSLIIIGSKSAFNEAVMNNYSKIRKTTLTEKIMNSIENYNHNNIEV